MRTWAFADVPMAEVARWWDERPCNIRHSRQPVGSFEYFEEVAHRKLVIVEPHLSRFIAGIRGGSTIFNVGCGIGTETVELARYAKRVIAVDVSAESVRIARHNVALRAERSDRVDLVVADVTDLDQLTAAVGGRTPDVIFSYGVLHHVPRPDLALINLRTVARPGTELRIMLYHRWSTKAIRLGLTNRRIAKGSEARPDSPITYAFTRRGARRLLETAGWQVERMWVDHIFPWQGPAYGRGEYRPTLLRRLLPGPVFRRLERILGWHIMIVARR